LDRCLVQNPYWFEESDVNQLIPASGLVAHRDIVLSRSARTRDERGRERTNGKRESRAAHTIRGFSARVHPVGAMTSSLYDAAGSITTAAGRQRSQSGQTFFLISLGQRLDRQGL
jgi:hypothetical protein